MIPSAESLVAGYEFASRRWGLSGEVSESAIRAAVENAKSLVEEDQDEPSALFYSFARRPRAFVGAWRRMSVLLAVNQARTLGLRLHTTVEEVNRLLTLVAANEIAFDGVREWFAERLRPRE